MADRKQRSRGLGRGLSALMADVAESHGATEDRPRQPDRRVPIERIWPNPDQPRRDFDEAALNDLAASIREKGVIQPLIVRPRKDAEDEFEIVAGERRWRAAQIARLHDVPVLVREFDDSEVLEIAIIENVQRADLNPVEEAAGYQQLMERFGHTQERLAAVLGKSRSHIANSLRLLSLPEEVLSLVREGQLSAGHARALITADDPLALARSVVKKGLSVRQTEALARQLKGEETPAATPRKQRLGREKDADTRVLEGDLSAGLGMKVTIEHKPGQDSGRLVISYGSLEELDELCRILSIKD